MSVANKIITICLQGIPTKAALSIRDDPNLPIGTVIAKEENRTRRVDKGKSGQALKTAVSGGFGGGILSQN